MRHAAAHARSGLPGARLAADPVSCRARTPANAPLTQSARTPANAPLTQSARTPANAPLTQSARTPANAPLLCPPCLSSWERAGVVQPSRQSYTAASIDTLPSLTQVHALLEGLADRAADDARLLAALAAAGPADEVPPPGLQPLPALLWDAPPDHPYTAMHCA